LPSSTSNREGSRIWRNRLLPFGWSNVSKLAVAYFFATLYFYIPVSTLYLQGRGLNYVQINSLWGVIAATTFVAEVPAGIVADRLGRKHSINIALALQALGEVVFIFADSYGPFVLAAMVGGLGFAFSSGCVEALVYDSLRMAGDENEMSRAMGFIDAAQRLANLLAFAVGGLLVVDLAQERFVLAIVVTACAVAVGWLFSLTLREPRIELEPGDDDSSAKLLVDGIRMLRDNKQLRGLALLALATIPFRDYLLNLYQPRFVSVGVPSVWLGLALALSSSIGILGARYAYLLEARIGAKHSLLLVTSLPGVLYLMMGTVSQPVFSVLVFCTLLGSMSLRAPILSGHLNRHIGSKNRATMLSLINMFSGIYVALIGLLIGWIGDLSLTYAFVFMGTTILVGSLWFRVS
jgi:MFS family permease